MGNHSIYSPALNADVILDNNEMEIFRVFSKDYPRKHSDDPKDYVGLSSLGYLFSGFNVVILNTDHPPQIEQITQLKVKPDIADHARRLLNNNPHVFRSTLFNQAISQVSLEDVKAIEKRGFKTHMAIIIAAFPQEEARLSEIRDHDLDFDKEVMECSHDVGTLARLNRLAGPKDMTRIIKYLDQGFTEAELKKFGFLVPYVYTPEQLRSTQARPMDIKNVLNVFLPNIMGNSRNSKKQLFVPTFSQLEAIINSGVKSAKQYKEMADMRERKITSSALADEIPVILNAVSFSDAKEIHERSGAIWVEEIVAIGGILDAGHSLDDYFDILEAVDPETERGMRLEISPAYNALNLLERGMSLEEISRASHEGTALFRM
jgi:hypothetical protein